MIIASSRRTQPGGIRRVDLPHDLRAIADLIEVCFSPQLDAGGRATIQEMRALSRMGPLLRVLALGDRMLRGIGMGFVWEADGRIVGNVTLFPADFPASPGRPIVVANVAVAPDYRRRGIARRLMEAGLDAIRAGGGTAAILQVDADNDSARALYRELGFRTERVWNTWYHSGQDSLPARLLNGPRVTPRPAGLWQAEYALAARVFPAAQGGLGWQRPLHRREFQRGLPRQALDFLAGTATEHWIVREEQAIRGALHLHTRFGSGAVQLTLIVPPEEHERLAEPLLAFGLRRASTAGRWLSCEHPADDTATSELLRRYRFTVRRALEHMRLDL